MHLSSSFLNLSDGDIAAAKSAAILYFEVAVAEVNVLFISAVFLEYPSSLLIIFYYCYPLILTQTLRILCNDGGSQSDVFYKIRCI